MSTQHTPRSLKHEAPPPDAYTDPDIMLDEDVAFWIVEEQEAGEVLAGVYKTAHGEEEANARVMAAAPELLDALKTSRGQWIHSVNAERCLAAIAKAEGRS